MKKKIGSKIFHERRFTIISILIYTTTIKSCLDHKHELDRGQNLLHDRCNDDDPHKNYHYQHKHYSNLIFIKGRVGVYYQ